MKKLIKKLIYRLFNSNIYNRYKKLRSKQIKRLEILINIRSEMVRYDRFYFDMPIMSRKRFRDSFNLEDNEQTTKLFIRLLGPAYDNMDKLKKYAKEFPLENIRLIEDIYRFSL